MSRRQLKSLATLDRIEQMTLDDLRQEITVIQKQQDLLKAQLHALKEKKQYELLIRENPHLSLWRVPYFNEVERNEKELKKYIELLEKKIGALLDDLSESFYRKKRLEITTKKIVDREKEQEDQKEQALQDELALTLFQR